MRGLFYEIFRLDTLPKHIIDNGADGKFGAANHRTAAAQIRLRDDVRVIQFLS